MKSHLKVRFQLLNWVNKVRINIIQAIIINITAHNIVFNKRKINFCLSQSNKVHLKSTFLKSFLNQNTKINKWVKVLHKRIYSLNKTISHNNQVKNLKYLLKAYTLILMESSLPSFQHLKGNLDNFSNMFNWMINWKITN